MQAIASARFFTKLSRRRMADVSLTMLISMNILPEGRSRVCLMCVWDFEIPVQAHVRAPLLSHYVIYYSVLQRTFNYRVMTNVYTRDDEK
jgi:hypothetical protein